MGSSSDSLYGSVHQNKSGTADSHLAKDDAQITPILFARLVLDFSKRNTHFLFSGKHYAALARLLMSPYQRYGESEDAVELTNMLASSIYIHDFSENKQNYIQSINDITQLELYDEAERRKKPSGRLIFLQGFMSPAWLNHIGSKFNVDPEFYFRHLDFSSLMPRPEHFPMHSLPSGAADILRIHTVSTFSWNTWDASAQNLSALRQKCQSQMDEYLRNLSKAQNVAASDSIVRRFSIHDKHHLSIEQMISVQVSYDSPGWIAFIWLDQGNDLSFSKTGPWNLFGRGISSSLAQPIIQHRKHIALRTVSRSSSYPGSDTENTLDQSIAFSYGRSLRRELMQCDAFYALDELFRLSIASEGQFLTLLSHKIKLATHAGKIEDLKDILDILESHREFILENIHAVEIRGNSKWPQAPERLRSKVLESHGSLRTDLIHLKEYLERLVERCRQGSTVIMNETTSRQSQLALDETKATLKLSVLVFFFAPLSVTTSIFSMDVNEIKNGGLSIWQWAVISASVLLITFTFWKWNPFCGLRKMWHQFSTWSRS